MWLLCCLCVLTLGGLQWRRWNGGRRWRSCTNISRRKIPTICSRKDDYSYCDVGRRSPWTIVSCSRIGYVLFAYFSCSSFPSRIPLYLYPIVCLLAFSFARLLFRSLTRSSPRLLVRSSVRLLLCSFVPSFLLSSPSFLPSFPPSLLPSGSTLRPTWSYPSRLIPCFFFLLFFPRLFRYLQVFIDI